MPRLRYRIVRRKIISENVGFSPESLFFESVLKIVQIQALKLVHLITCSVAWTSNKKFDANVGSIARVSALTPIYTSATNRDPLPTPKA